MSFGVANKEKVLLNESEAQKTLVISGLSHLVRPCNLQAHLLDERSSQELPEDSRIDRVTAREQETQQADFQREDHQQSSRFEQGTGAAMLKE